MFTQLSKCLLQFIWNIERNIWTFFILYISSALENDRCCPIFFLCFYVFFLWYTIFDRGHMFSQFWCILTRMNKWDTQGVKNPPISQKSSIYILFTAHKRLSILVSTFIEFFPVHFRIGRKKNYSVTLNFIASGHQIY